MLFVVVVAAATSSFLGYSIQERKTEKARERDKEREGEIAYTHFSAFCLDKDICIPFKWATYI